MLAHGRVRNYFGLTILVLVLLSVILSVSLYQQETKVVAKISARMRSDSAELYLRLADALSEMNRHLPNHNLEPIVASAKKPETISLYKKALISLYEADVQNSENPLLDSKLAIANYELGYDGSVWLNALVIQDEAVAKELHQVLGLIYQKNDFNIAQSQQTEIALKKLLPESWYQEKALLRFYKKTDNQLSYSKLKEEVEQKNRSFLERIILLSLVGAVSILTGSLAFVIQLFISAKGNQQSTESNHVLVASANYGWRTVYIVFLAWMVTQLAVGLLARSFVGHIGLTTENVLRLALQVATIYLLSNLPVIFYIYHFALKPNDIGLFDGLKLDLSKSNLSLAQAVQNGIVTWLAAIPVVLLSYVLAAKYFHAHGSSNPIIAVITEAARSKNLPAALLFYMVLGIFAPFCEEVLFRGFLYCYLRRNFNVLVSALASAGLFSLVHLDLGGILPLFCLGVMFALAVEKTNSILPAMIAHGLWNSGTFTVVLLLFSN